MKYSLEVDSVNKSYNGKAVLSDIYMNCETQDIIGIFGRNGSGKSTLLKIIYGTLNADYKFIKLNNIVENQPYKVKSGISYLPQDNFIPKYFTVKKAIGLSVNKSEIAEFFDDEIIDSINQKKVANLSGGELKYLQVKIILYTNSKFCLLDEPYNGTSPIIAEKINTLILKQANRKGIIITDHSYQNLLQVANKIYLIKDRSGRFLNNKEDLIKFGYLSPDML